mmetsp:Transcript_49437/g.112199  ORF Transcript_49437/g.112199 Transcript_49437/m.112199 type:complete len:200 (-) Transcript_49437:442-1041(-)
MGDARYDFNGTVCRVARNIFSSQSAPSCFGGCYGSTHCPWGARGKHRSLGLGRDAWPVHAPANVQVSRWGKDAARRHVDNARGGTRSRGGRSVDHIVRPHVSAAGVDLFQGLAAVLRPPSSCPRALHPGRPALVSGACGLDEVVQLGRREDPGEGGGQGPGRLLCHGRTNHVQRLRPGILRTIFVLFCTVLCCCGSASC